MGKNVWIGGDVVDSVVVVGGRVMPTTVEAKVEDARKYGHGIRNLPLAMRMACIAALEADETCKGLSQSDKRRVVDAAKLAAGCPAS